MQVFVQVIALDRPSHELLMSYLHLSPAQDTLCVGMTCCSHQSVEHAKCVQVLFSLELHLLSPYARRYIKTKSVAADQALAVAMHTTVFVLFMLLSVSVASVYVLLLYFLTFVCPLCLMRVQKYKAQINGPWDEAVPSIHLKQFSNVSAFACK